jgi:hypothetical protein
MNDPDIRVQKTDGPRLTPTEARQSVPTGHVRYILAISLGLAVVAVAAVWLFGIF